MQAQGLGFRATLVSSTTVVLQKDTGVGQHPGASVHGDKALGRRKECACRRRAGNSTCCCRAGGGEMHQLGRMSRCCSVLKKTKKNKNTHRRPTGCLP